MKWPWVSQARLDAAESRVQWTEQQLRAAEERLAEAQAAADEQLDAAEAERQKLLDRILQLSGQPALYAPAPPQSAEPRAQSTDKAADKGSVLPPARRLVDVSDIHAAFREAASKDEVQLKPGWVF